jgi:lipopolysaccharide biosynthesis glycosyltransferase
MDGNLRVVVVAGADNRYAMPLAVLLKSAVLNLSAKVTLHAYVLDGGISVKNRNRIQSSVSGAGIVISWISLDQAIARLKDVPVFGHVSKATYFRLLLADLLPLDETRAIYIDVDTVVLSDLSVLWRVEMEGCSLGAVPDGSTISTGRGIPGYKDLGIPPDAPRFNGGVLLVDLQKWRECETAKRCLEYLKKYHDQVQFWDQDALNALLSSDWVKLPKCWNYRVDCHTVPDANMSVEEQLSKIRNDAAIIHYASATKPWHYYADHPGKVLFYEYLDQTAWRGWRPHAPIMAYFNRHYWGKLARKNRFLNQLRTGFCFASNMLNDWRRS